ncbi:YCF48-related protein [Paraglaciecola sp.]|uniref:YCF48-related protein n=1 Tax=Pseudomonadati TaxID=3379134 RepID=UPI00273E85A2|nr:YCF48-related protein [Paraglaciecola sp.]MDP5031098.1 YCF48-related protein [Paraglaciecola sp.]
MLLKKLSFTLLFLLPSLASAEANNQAFIAPLAVESLLLDITRNSDTFIVVGERGHILRSADGDHWQQVQVPTLSTLTAVQALDQHVWAVGHDATILKSTDSGQNWTVQYRNPELEKPLLDVLFFNEKHGIAVGAYGLFLRTSDGGENWVSELHAELLNPDDKEYMDELKQEDETFYQEELLSILPNINRVSIDGTTLYMAGEAGLLAFSNDMGTSWQRMDIDYSGSFFDIKRTQSGRLFAAGLRGNVYEFNEQEWIPLASPTTFTLNSIVSVDKRRSIILGNNGAVLTIDDNGLRFSQTDEGKSLINAEVQNNKLLAVSEVGIKNWVIKD